MTATIQATLPRRSLDAFAHDRLAFIAEASRILASSLDYEETLTSIARSLVPEYADDSLVYLLEDGVARQVAEASRDPSSEALLRELRKEPVLTGRGLTAQVLETGQPVFAPEMPATYFDNMSENWRGILQRVRPRSLISVPMIANGEVLGAITFGFSQSYRKYGPADVLLAEELGHRAGLAVANAKLYRRTQESVRHLQAVISCIMDGVMVTDAAGRVVLANEHAARLVGVPLEDKRQLCDLASTLLPASSGGEGTPLALLERALAGERIGPVERVLVSAEGTTTYLRAGAAPLRDANGRITGAVLSIGDITRTKELERERQRNEERLAHLHAVTSSLSESLTPVQIAEVVVQHATSGLGAKAGVVARLDPAGRELEILAALGMRSEELPLVAAVKEARPIFIEKCPPHLALSECALPLLVGGRAVGVLGLSFPPERQVVEYDRAFLLVLARQCAQALERARLYEEAQRTARLREELLAVVSHDLKNPLGAILLNAEMVLTAVPNDRRKAARRQAEAIARSATRMNHLIRTLLEAASIEAGKLVLDFKSHELGSLIDESVAMLEVIASRKSIVLEKEISPGLPPAWCDRERVLRVLSNLIGNAIKFSSSSGSISVRAESFLGEIRLSVKDAGPGISEDQLPHIFERFSRTRPMRHDGTGLGLYIAKAIVEAHGGRIWVETQAGGGSSFFFTLPISRSPFAEETQTGKEDGASHGT